MKRNFTMRKTCKACFCRFTITSAASMFCQNAECKNKRRRDDRAAAKKAAQERLVLDGSSGHLARALESGQ